MLVGVGARQPRGDLGAVDRLRHYAKGFAKHGKVEPRKVKNLEQSGVGQEPLEIGRDIQGSLGVRWDLHNVRRAVARRKLNQA